MHPNLKYWLGFNLINGIGPITIKKLFDHFGSIEKAWFASLSEISTIEGLRKEPMNAFLNNREITDLDGEIDKLDNIKAICFEEDNYPQNLKNIYDPPPVLYFNGDILPEDENAIAIVGTRKASNYGLAIAEKLSKELANYGFTIISGLAMGIDAAAHEGSINAGGRTIAVLGGGIDSIGPKCNLYIAEKIEKSGAIISEFPLGTQPDKTTFPRRNRIIAGLSKGVIVVEGLEDSGALITARFAIDEGREVFAVPGNIDAEGSRGPHSLIKQGAKLVGSVEDVLEEFCEIIPKPETRNSNKNRNPKLELGKILTEDENIIYSALSREPKHIDLISAETQLHSWTASSLLMGLEIKKVVKQLPGKYFMIA
ncbi:MAG: DNA-processing protein DprA [Candidatus Margulisiibacteriota bacterium]